MVEKGAYRLRAAADPKAPLRKSAFASGHFSSNIRTHSRLQKSNDGFITNQNKSISILIVILTLATVTSFAVAWYLFQTA